MEAERLHDSSGVPKPRIQFNAGNDSATYRIATSRISKSGKLSSLEQQRFAALPTKQGYAIVNRDSLTKRFRLNRDKAFDSNGKVTQEAIRTMKRMLGVEGKINLEELEKGLEELSGNVSVALHRVVPSKAQRIQIGQRPAQSRPSAQSDPQGAARQLAGVVMEVQVEAGKDRPNFVPAWSSLDSITQTAEQQRGQDQGEWKLIHTYTTQIQKQLDPYVFEGR